jgi:hypothetical protein
MKKLMTILGAFLFASVVLTSCGGGDSITKEEYNKITNGMTYEECVSVIGFEGEEMSTVHQDGIPGIMEAMTVQIYMWQNSGGSNMNATFTNGKLDMKAQFGL